MFEVVALADVADPLGCRRRRDAVELDVEGERVGSTREPFDVIGRVDPREAADHRRALQIWHSGRADADDAVGQVRRQRVDAARVDRRRADGSGHGGIVGHDALRPPRARWLRTCQFA
jgi:hypothetical protein